MTMEDISAITSKLDLKFEGEFNLNTFLKRRKYMYLTLLIEDGESNERHDFNGSIKELNGKVIKSYPIIYKETSREIIIKYPEKFEHMIVYFEYRRPKTHNTKITRIGAISAVLR